MSTILKKDYDERLTYEIANHITPKLANFFEKHIKDKAVECTSDTLENYIMYVLEFYLHGATTEKDITDARRNIFRNRNNTKRRWFKTLEQEMVDGLDNKRNHMYISKEIEGIEIFFNSEANSFKETFKVNSLDELKENIFEKCKVWNDDDNETLTDFRYILKKKPSILEGAFKVDLILNTLDIIINEFNGNINGYRIQRPISLIDQPIFGSFSEVLATTNGVIPNTNEPCSINEYQVSENLVIKTYLKEYLAGDGSEVKFNNEPIKSLDAKDSDIIDYAISNIDDVTFIKTRTVEISIGKLAKYVYKDVTRLGKFHYDDLMNRLNKLPLFMISGFIIDKATNTTNETFLLNIFDSVNIINNDKNKPEYAKITFGNNLYNNYVKQQMLSVSTSKVRDLKGQLAKLLVFNFTQQLAEMYVEGNKDLIRDYSYAYFRSVVRMKRKTTKEGMKEIENALIELKEKKILVKDYSRNGLSSFLISFYPLTRLELQNCNLIQENV